jgi:hypothetical protein
LAQSGHQTLVRQCPLLGDKADIAQIIRNVCF